MASSYTALTYHLVFGTKRRRRALSAEIRPRVFAYLGGVVKAKGGTFLAIGGVEDHVHVLLQLRPTHNLAAFVRAVKSNTSKWINASELCDERFEWQSGYGAFTVSQSQIPVLRRYLARQEEHHKNATYLDEVEFLCNRHNIARPPPSPEGPTDEEPGS